MDRFSRICRDIKALKIQGAEAVARAALEALQIRSDRKAIETLAGMRPTEPMLRNAIRFASPDPKILAGKALRLFDRAAGDIALIGSNKIQNGMKVFTHCHSSTVMNILKEAGRQGRRFEVFCTETRPLFQGRKTAGELAKAGIPVTILVDSAARLALKKCDIALYGCDAITTERVINKIGSEMFAIIADKYDVPVYICTNSWKFDPATVFGAEEPIEKRNPKEIWTKPPRGVKIINPAFERIDPDLISGIISEFGVYKFDAFIEEVRRRHRWLFQ